MLNYDPNEFKEHLFGSARKLMFMVFVKGDKQFHIPLYIDSIAEHKESGISYLEIAPSFISTVVESVHKWEQES